MAPSSKLKQPSIDSFLHAKLKSKSQTSPAIPNPNPANSAAASDYEQIRRDTIRRNQDFLQKLGIFAATAAVAPKSKAPARRLPKPSTSPSSVPPLRRSSRHKHPPPSFYDGSAVAAAEDCAAVEPPFAPSFVDSSVFQYVCDDNAAGGACALVSPHDRPTAVPSSFSSPIARFKVVGKAFRDPFLTKIYSVDVYSLEKDRFLVTAGGHGGFISVYGGGEDDGCPEEESERETIGPLMSWKGSSSWISGVKFVKENPFLLISSSNDGSVVVWDVKRQPVSMLKWSPPVVLKSTELHSGGIYCMDRLDCWIATASKDSSVCISRLTPAGELLSEQKIAGHHSGVIKGVCFGDEKHHIADCGADGSICVLDTRSPEPCALTIKSQYSAGVNTVEWSKSNSFLILSASKDPVLHLYDIRLSARPVHSQLQGHVEPQTRTCHQIYRPCFVGTRVATPGQGSRKISLYDVDKSMLISQGRIGYDANLVIFTEDTQHRRLWAAGRQINQLCPTTEPQNMKVDFDKKA